MQRRGTAMPTKRLPALDSFDYEYLLHEQRRRKRERLLQEQSQRRRLVSRSLGRLAEALSFLENDTVQRGMQLELY